VFDIFQRNIWLVVVAIRGAVSHQLLIMVLNSSPEDGAWRRAQVFEVGARSYKTKEWTISRRCPMVELDTLFAAPDLSLTSVNS
jgi:hypothetical protein